MPLESRGTEAAMPKSIRLVMRIDAWREGAHLSGLQLEPRRKQLVQSF